MTRFELVWGLDASPHVAVERASVNHNDRSWQQLRIVVGDGRPGVVVIPVHRDLIGFVRHWRPVVDQTRLELPRGFGERNDPKDDARRELREETGLQIATLRQVGAFDLDTGLMPTPIKVFEATVLDQTPTGTTDGEADELIWLSSTELKSALVQGELCDAITLAALAQWYAIQTPGA
jgi:ADP-ribose pyrophosphatase